MEFNFFKKYIIVSENYSSLYILKRLFEKFFSFLVNYLKYYKNRFISTRYEPVYAYNSLRLNLTGVKCDNISDKIVENYLAHRFDILGSGWINVNEDTADWFGYKPINWHIDFKSGFRWDKTKWYKFIKYGIHNGVDIKTPWELARLQHLPQLAIYCSTLSEEDDLRNKISKEFENVVTDFILNNPVCYGVNWVCPMDVAIRAANIILAYEIFLNAKVDFDPSFSKKITKSLFEHGKYIISNLEWNGGLTANHYLANIAGLLFISSVIENEVSDQWLIFSVNEIINEFSKQFYSDGINFESSTSYHRLSSEIIVYSTALILGFDNSRIERIRRAKFYDFTKSNRTKCFSFNEWHCIFPSWYQERLFKALNFTQIIQKSNNEVPQIGDNDSGRFFKISMVGQYLSSSEAKKKYINLSSYISDDDFYFDENVLDHRTLTSTIPALFNLDINPIFVLEYIIVQALAKGRKFEPNSTFSHEINQFKNLSDSEKLHSEFNFENTYEIPFPENSKSIFDGLQYFYFDKGGFCLYKSERLYLLIVACPNGQYGIGGHAHNDKLSFELEIDGKCIFYDPGTYIYTSYPDFRNLFRSTNAHNAIITNAGEQSDWIPNISGLFSLKNEPKTYVIYAKASEILLETRFKHVVHRRKFQLKDKSLLINDFCNVSFSPNFQNFKYYSNGYGKIMAS